MKSKNSDLKIKKPKKPNFLGFIKKPKKPRFFKMGLDSPGKKAQLLKPLLVGYFSYGLYQFCGSPLYFLQAFHLSSFL